MKDFTHLRKNLKKDFSGLIQVKVAVLGDTSTQFLAEAIRGMGYEKDFNIVMWEADYNQIERQVFDNTSELYKYKPEIIIIFQSSHKLLSKFNKLQPNQYNTLARTELGIIDNTCNTLFHNLNTKIIFYNYSEINDAVFGNYSNKTESSFLFQLRKLNYELMEYAIKNHDFYLCDLSAIQNRFGRAVFFQPSVYVNAEMVLSIDVLPEVASKTIDIISALRGKFIKCVILDLDNTTWGGIIGEDGIENIQLGSLGIGKAFTEFQYWIKKLKNRGIIIAVCSKNSEHIAKKPFEKHPDMVLQLKDIAVFIANWGNKVDNIIQIQSILNIGYDSMVFIDDSPFERNIVRESLPDVCVPELPEDPADYLEYLYGLNLFETTSVSGADAERTRQYQIEAQRSIVQQKFTNEDDYLKSLNILSVVEPFNKYNTPRVAQLSQRSNQFNLRTVRFTETDIKKIAESETHFTFAFTLEDKFGDNGLTGVIILQKEDTDTVFINTWFMSCRILKRGMEQFMLNTIASFSIDNGYNYLKGEYIPTIKNEMVKEHYKNLGFEKSGEFWVLPLKDYEYRKCFINRKLGE